jgi:hypothetical protein
MHAARIQNLLRKIEVLRQRADKFEWFGAKTHQFMLNPPLAQSELIAFETQHGISLPEDYRQFLLLAGNGGVGPYYGITPLARWNEWFEDESESPGYLAAPCPLVYEEMTSPAWCNHFPTEDGELGRGSIHICSQGCSFSARLVVAGPSYGRIFNLCLDAVSEVAFCKAVGSDLHLQKAACPVHFVMDANFLDWYERWLDQALTGEPPGWFGYDNPHYTE